MQELKPVGKVQSMLYIDWKNEDNTHGVAFVDRKIAPGTDLYALPDTHRIVPVELLESAMSVFSVEGFDKEADQLSAIIDKEPT
jgi:hypothetical protein